MVARRPHGTGSVYFEADRGRWVGTYEAGWTPRGTRRRRKVTGRTEREVRRKLVEAQRSTQVETPAARATVRTWAEAWLEVTQTRVSPHTWSNDASAVRRWIVPTVGHRRLDQLRASDVRAVQRAILAAGLKESTAQRAHAVLMTMLRAAVREGYAVPDSALRTEGVRRGEVDRDAIPPDDLRAILDVAQRRPDASRWLAAIALGLRPAEALGLTWSRVNLETGAIDTAWQVKALPYRTPRDRTSGFRVPVGYEARRLHDAWHLVRPKTKAGRRITYASAPVLAALRAWRDSEHRPHSPYGLVWPNKDGRVRDPREDRAAWYALTDAAQVANVDDDGRGRRYALYEARHAFATTARLHATNDTLTELMGHASILSTHSYLHRDEAAARAALEATARTLGLATPEP